MAECFRPNMVNEPLFEVTESKHLDFGGNPCHRQCHDVYETPDDGFL